MIRRFSLAWVLTLLCVVLASAATNAAWVKNGVPACAAPDYQFGPRIIPDGRNGAIVVWSDLRTGIDYDVYGNDVERGGNVFGDPGGLALCTAAGDQFAFGVVFNGPDGVIVAWNDQRNGNWEIYAQRVDTMGVLVWGTDGINVCPGTIYANNPRIVSDGFGGAIIVWNENRGSSSDVYAQRIDADGNLLWGDDGIEVCADPADQYFADVLGDGSGGAIFVWTDARGDQDIYAQRVDDEGTTLWDDGGVVVCAGWSGQDAARLAPAPGGGAYVVWSDFRFGYSDAFAQRIDQDGTPHWMSDGVSVCDDAGLAYYKESMQLVGDGSGGLIVAWYDYRDGNNNMVYAQRFDPDGARAWGPYGRMLIPSYSYEGGLGMVSDGSGGAIVTGAVYMDEDAADPDVNAQRVDRGGNALWGPTGVTVCASPGAKYGVVATPDGFGGTIIAWEDSRPTIGSRDIYCQRVGSSGLWGDPEPSIVSCADVPADQGGWVRIRTRASALDSASEGDTPIFAYNAWRLIGGGGPLAANAQAAAAEPPVIDRSSLAALLRDPKTAVGVRVGATQAASLGLPEGDWESVGFWFATRDTVYNAAVPTKDDSTGAGSAQETYCVTAHTMRVGMFVASAPESGYSVDNLAPPPVTEFAGTETASPPGLELTWSPSAAPDLDVYNVYRGTDDLFVPGPGNLLGTTSGTALHDGTWLRAFDYFYKLVAVDSHGNAGPAALLGPVDIKVGTMLQSFAASLEGSGIEVTWKLSEADEHVSFSVLRSAGGAEYAELASVEIAREGLSFTLNDRSVEPGTAYRYRVSVVEGSGTRVLFETGAISTPVIPLTLYQNHPNPFNPATMIGYYLPAASVVRLEVYDSSGRLISRVVDGVMQERGTHEAAWLGCDGAGRRVSSGVYFYRLTSGKETISKKMVLLR